MEYSTLEIAGAQAIELLELKRESYRSSGEYPFLIGDEDTLLCLQAIANFEGRAPSEIVQRSLSLDLANWMSTRREEQELYSFDAEQVLGSWPDQTAAPGAISLHRDEATNKTKPKVQMGFAQIDQPWHLPAMLRFGNWNDCPDAVVHCAFFARWQRLFGAEIAAASSDTLECIVNRPPQDKEAALALAWEQFWYCGDVIHQGCDSISKLAAQLLESNYWRFSWD